jgi:hypothetical protein
MNFQKATIFTIGGGLKKGAELQSEQKALSVIPEITVGAKGFAKKYADGGVSKPMRVVAETESGCVLVTFFDGRAAQHTRRKDITGVTRVGGSVEKARILQSSEETPFIPGDKVWALETGKGWMRGKVIEVFSAYKSALVKFYHETGYPSQNTLFSEISKEKPK